MIEDQLLPKLYMVKVPFPGAGLGYTNVYIVKGKDRNLVIDTGVNHVSSQKVMEAAFRQYDIDLTKTDFFLTHYHSDHNGLVSEFRTDTSEVYISSEDGEIFADEKSLDNMIDFYILNGFPEELRADIDECHPGRVLGADKSTLLHIVEDGFEIDVGGYSFKAIKTPGHTPGHMCLYEANKKILISGDHIIEGISPNVSQAFKNENLLEDYMGSLAATRELDVELVLPGHKKLIKTNENYKNRIDWLINHHGDRLEEAKKILEQGPMTAYQAAKQMKWEIPPYDDWDRDVSSMNKVFIIGEAIAHLTYLEKKGELTKEVKDRKIVYRLK